MKCVHALEMTADARPSVVNHWIVRVRFVAHDVHRRFIETPALAVDDKVALETIRQMKDDFAAVGAEVEGIPEDVLLRIVAAEVEALPICAVNRRVAFHGPIVPGHAGVSQAESPGEIVLKIEFGIDM